MPFGNEPERVGGELTVSREPVGPKRGGDKGTVGDLAFKDALIILSVCWLFLFFLMFSLHKHNV